MHYHGTSSANYYFRLEQIFWLLHGILVGKEVKHSKWSKPSFFFVLLFGLFFFIMKQINKIFKSWDEICLFSAFSQQTNFFYFFFLSFPLWLIILYFLSAHKSKLTCLCYAQNACRLFSADENGTLVCWDMTTQRLETPEWKSSDNCQLCDSPYFWNLKEMWAKKVGEFEFEFLIVADKWLLQKLQKVSYLFRWSVLDSTTVEHVVVLFVHIVVVTQRVIHRWVMNYLLESVMHVIQECNNSLISSSKFSIFPI